MSESDYMDAADLVASLPDDLRAELAQGPMEEPFCRVCSVLKHDETGIAKGDVAHAIIDFHLVSGTEKVYAVANTLGTDRRLSTAEYASARRALREGDEALHTGIDVLADQLSYTRCLFLYLLAGWKPPTEEPTT